MNRNSNLLVEKNKDERKSICGVVETVQLLNNNISHRQCVEDTSHIYDKRVNFCSTHANRYFGV